jgi:environmental stress-induced protein Ves
VPSSPNPPDRRATPALRILRAADARRVPWRNGRGVTEELALAPDGASFGRGDFDWRIARATVAQAGPFSAFPGFERVLVVVQGAGLRLEHGSDAPPAHVTPLAPYRFSGDWATSATPLDGPVTDVNVLARRGVVRAEVELLRSVTAALGAPPDAGEWLLHVLAGGLALRAAEAAGVPVVALGPGDSLRADGRARAELLDEAPGTLALLVRLRRAPAPA